MVSAFLQIDGTLVAPDNPKNWDPKLPRVWLDFSKLKKAVFQGSGIIDGSGSKWWAASCKKNKTNVNFQKKKLAFSILQVIFKKETYVAGINNFLFFFLSSQPCKGAPTVRTTFLTTVILY
jgi:hypothetical protein